MRGAVCTLFGFSFGISMDNSASNRIWLEELQARYFEHVYLFLCVQARHEIITSSNRKIATNCGSGIQSTHLR